MILKKLTNIGAHMKPRKSNTWRSMVVMSCRTHIVNRKCLRLQIPMSFGQVDVWQERGLFGQSESRVWSRVRCITLARSNASPCFLDTCSRPFRVGHWSLVQVTCTGFLRGAISCSRATDRSFCHGLCPQSARTTALHADTGKGKPYPTPTSFLGSTESSKTPVTSSVAFTGINGDYRITFVRMYFRS